MNKLVTFFRETSMGRFLIGAGIILIIFGCIVRSFAKDNANYIKTDAVVTKTELFEEADEKNNTEALYTVDVKYIVDGTEYEEEYGVFSGYKVGDQVMISYDPKNPAEIAQPARPGSNKLEGYLFILAGIAALAAGIVSLARAAQKHKALKEQEKEWTNG